MECSLSVKIGPHTCTHSKMLWFWGRKTEKFTHFHKGIMQKAGETLSERERKVFEYKMNEGRRREQLIFYYLLVLQS